MENNKRYLQVLNPSKLTLPKFRTLLEQYRTVEQYPTFGGLLNYLSISWNDWKDMQHSTDTTTMKIVKVMTMYKEYLESEIEKLMVYQNHSNKFYNYAIARDYLKKSNPDRFGDKIVKVENKEKKGIFALGDFSNNSGVSIFDDDSDEHKS